MNGKLHCLVIENSELDFTRIERELDQLDQHVTCIRVDTPPALEDALRDGHWDVVISAYQIPGLRFEETLTRVVAQRPEVPLLLVSGTVSRERASAFLKQGVWDFVPKDTLARLAPAVDRCVREADERRKRTQAESELRSTNERLRNILASALDGYWLVDPNGRIIDANNAACVMLGYTREELLSLRVADIEAFEQPEDVDARIIRLLKTGGERFEGHHRRKDGFVMDVEVSITVLRADASLSVFIRDITARKQAEAVSAFLSQVGTRAPGETFFQALAQFLAQSLQMDYICIDHLEGDGLSARTLAVWCNGRFEDNVTYTLHDTPCGDVVGSDVCCFPANVRQLFPHDQALQDLNAESYVGVTLWSHAQQPIGLIAVIGRTALVNREIAESTLKRIASRASYELERLAIQTALEDSENRFRTLIESLPEAIGVIRNGDVVYVSPAAVRMFGATTPQELVGKHYLDLVHPDFHGAARVRVKTLIEQGTAPMIEERYLRLDGSMFEAESQITSILYSGERATLAVLHDIAERKRIENDLRLAASVFSHAREGIAITDPGGAIIEVNETFVSITGYSREEILGQNPRVLSSGRHGKEFYTALWRTLLEQGHWSGEIWNRRKTGEVYAEMLTISAVRDTRGNTEHYVALFSDITPIKEHQTQLEHIAHYDPLTTLPNRVLLADRLQQAMAQAQRRGQPLAVAYLDLDGFKTINDRYGHDAGDKLLMAVAARMKEDLREGDTLARLGGDEFVAVLLDLADVAASVPMLTRLLDAAAEPVAIAGNQLQVSASLGVTFYPQTDDVDADQLLRQADQAMYQAKLAGKNRYHVFDSAQDRSVRGHHESLERIRRALTAREFVLYYQPKVNMRTGTVIGAEALVRWQHPERGLLAPALFLPLIEDHPLAVDLGEWVIDSALTQLETWRKAGLKIPVSINVGARQLQQDNFVQRLSELLAAHPSVKPADLELEVLETSALQDLEHTSRTIMACREIGVSFALDDFGTGYSSLAYLKHLPVALLKIDQSFVRDMLNDPDDLAIIEGIVGLAGAFNRKVIAEGVETVKYGELLLPLGCELAQGYGIARPMPAADFPGWAANWRPDVAWTSWRGRSLNRDELAAAFIEVEHRYWLRTLETFLEGDRDSLSPLDAHDCYFGRWRSTGGETRHRDNPALPSVIALHERLHAVAREVADLHVSGQAADAQARLGELHQMLDELNARLRELLRSDKTISGH